jgi:hypothetical protein
MHSPHAASAEKDRQCKRAVLTVLASTLQLSPHRLKTRRTSLRFGPQMYDLCIWLPPTAIPKDVSHQRQVPSCHEPKVFHPNLVRCSGIYHGICQREVLHTGPMLISWHHRLLMKIIRPTCILID